MNKFQNEHFPQQSESHKRTQPLVSELRHRIVQQGSLEQFHQKRQKKQEHTQQNVSNFSQVFSNQTNPDTNLSHLLSKMMLDAFCTSRIFSDILLGIVRNDFNLNLIMAIIIFISLYRFIIRYNSLLVSLLLSLLLTSFNFIINWPLGIIINKLAFYLLSYYYHQLTFYFNYFYMHTHLQSKIIFISQKMKKFDKLIKFVRKGQIDKASEILQQTTLNINQLDQKTGKSLLHIVIQNSDVQMLKLLLSYPGIDLQKPSKQGQLPLQTAILLNDLAIVSKLLQTNNINPKKKTQNQQTLFEVAIRLQTSKDILTKLISYKFDPNQSVLMFGSLINLAIVHKQINNLIFLLNLNRENPYAKEPANLTITDQNDNTCLVLAVQHNQGDAVLAILEYLVQPHCKLSELQKQFFINSQNKQGNTALHIACLKNLQTITSLIQSHGAPVGLNVSLKNKKQQTIQCIKKQVLQNRLLSQQQQKRSFQQKKIYQKQKQIEKQRLRQEEQRFKQEEKRKRKEDQMVTEKQIIYQRQENKKKGLYICGIIAVVVVLLMYLVLTNSIQQKKLIGKDQFAK